MAKTTVNASEEFADPFAEDDIPDPFAQEPARPSTALVAAPAADSEGEIVFSTYPPAEQLTREQRMTIYNAISGETASIEDMVGKEIVVAGAICTSIEISDMNTLELRPATRTVLIAENGEYYSACSIGVLSSIRKLAQFVQPVPWAESLTVIPRMRKTARGYRVLTLELAE